MSLAIKKEEVTECSRKKEKYNFMERKRWVLRNRAQRLFFCIKRRNGVFNFQSWFALKRRQSRVSKVLRRD